jgi:sugar lactone lactonase YvrE
VFCTIGTFVGLRGGNAFPVLVRKTEPKALRVFLQDGSSDLDIYGGNWWIANQDMLSALEFAGYEVNHAWGDGGHDGKHGAAVFPDAMRWLWRDYPKPVASAKPSRNTFLQQVLLPGEAWTVASQGHTGVSSPVAGRDGEVFFADGAAGRIHRIDPTGKVTEFARDTGGAQALAFGADGRLYALGQNTGKLLRYDATGRAEVVAEEARASSAVRIPRGMYFADGDNRAISWIARQGARGSASTELSRLRGLAISPDQRLLYAADAATQWVWSYVLAADGTPGLGQPYFHLHVGDRTLESGAEAMTVDADGRLYVATHVGVQICDQAGRVNAILPLPANATATGIGFAGARLDLLHLAVGDTLYRRRMAVRGVIPDAAAIRPAPPRL